MPVTWRKGWALWKRERIFSPEGLYLDRLKIVETPIGGVFLHRLVAPDPDRELHDHPWPFVSIVLRGWYREQSLRGHGFPAFESDVGWVRNRLYWGVLSPSSRHLVVPAAWGGCVNRRRAEGPHRIAQVSPGGATTLVLVGPRWRRWGFATSAGWVDAETYFDERRAGAGWRKER